MRALPSAQRHPISELSREKHEIRSSPAPAPPEREGSHEELTLLRYYREAPLLQESMIGSKGSTPGTRHGCWGTVVLKDGKVLEVRYRSVPAGVDATDRCEEIFDLCLQSLPAP